MSRFTRFANRRTIYASIAFVGVAVIAWFAFLRPRPTTIVMTARAGDDTVIVNQTRATKLNASVLDQYHRRLMSDTAVRYQRLSGDAIGISPSGALQCDRRSNAIVRATFERLTRQFVLRCRPVASIELGSWLDLVVGDSARDLSFVAHGLDGRPETELRGVITAADASIIAIDGARIRPKRSGMTAVIVDVGDQQEHTSVVVYDSVSSFVDNPRKRTLMAMHVSLGQGDTIETPVPKAAFWVTYFPSDKGAAPPTIELRGDGLCTLGNGLTARRIADGEYAKYCYSANGTRMMIAHGAAGAARINGVVALRMMW